MACVYATVGLITIAMMRSQGIVFALGMSRPAFMTLPTRGFTPSDRGPVSPPGGSDAAAAGTRDIAAGSYEGHRP